MDLPCPCLEERCRAGRGRRARGEDVVDEEEPKRRRTVRDACEGARHRPQSLFPAASRLGSGRFRPADERGRGQPELTAESPREHASLIEAALGPPPGSERYPRHGVGRRRAERGECGRERLPDAAPPGELQPVDGGPGGSSVDERRPSGRDLCRRAVSTAIQVGDRREAAATAPRWLQGDQRTGARLAERPGARAAAGAGPWEQHVDRAIEHGATLRRAADTDQGSRTSTASSAPLTEIVTTACVFKTGYVSTDPAPVSASKDASSTGRRPPSALSAIAASAPS